MRMKMVIGLPVVLLVLCLGYLASGADDNVADTSSVFEEDSAMQELAGKIEKGLQSKEKDFSSESLRLVAKLWAEYREAWLSGEPVNQSRGGGGMPASDVTNYNDYLGVYAMSRAGATQPAKRQKLIEVAQDNKGRFLVKLEGHTIPAVRADNRLWITTGDITYAPYLPDFVEKPHASLEMFTIVRVKGRYYFAGTNSRDMEKEAMALTPTSTPAAPTN